MCTAMRSGMSCGTDGLYACLLACVFQEPSMVCMRWPCAAWPLQHYYVMADKYCGACATDFGAQCLQCSLANKCTTCANVSSGRALPMALGCGRGGLAFQRGWRLQHTFPTDLSRSWAQYVMRWATLAASCCREQP